MKAPVLGLYGAEDTGIPVTAVEALKKALEDNKNTAEFKIYPALRTASMPTIAQATAGKPPKMPGTRCRPGSRSTRAGLSSQTIPV
jgi:dienelactone hydrolase